MRTTPSSIFLGDLPVIDFGLLAIFLGPPDLLPWRIVGRSVGQSVHLSTSVTPQPMLGFFSKSLNIPWVNITRRFFVFVKF